MTPTKRSNGQCTCYPLAGEDKHLPDCPALYPLTSEPDALTKLTRHIRNHSDGTDEFSDHAIALISEAAEEKKALDATLRQEVEHRRSLEAKLAATEEVVTRLSNKTTETLRMGQQQGRVELATELLDDDTKAAPLPHWALDILNPIVDDDAEH